MKSSTKIYLFQVLFIFIWSNTKCQEPVKTYFLSGFNHGGKIELFADKTYLQSGSSVSCVMDENGVKVSKSEVHGTYYLRDNNLLLNPKVHMEKGYEDSIMSVHKNYESLSFYKKAFVIIEVDSATILLGNPKITNMHTRNELIDMANAINKSDSIGYLHMRTWKTDKSIHSLGKHVKKQFPLALQSYILDRPVDCELVKVEEVSFNEPEKDVNREYKRYAITFNKGKADGLRPGMILYPIQNEKNKCSITITNVFADKCVGFMEDYLDRKKCFSVTKYSTKKLAK